MKMFVELNLNYTKQQISSLRFPNGKIQRDDSLNMFIFIDLYRFIEG